jgi:hypothetical protein
MSDASTSANRIGHARLKALSKELQRPLQTLYALAPDNDPFLADQPFRRAAAEWYAELSQRLDIRPGVHLRRVHYVLISQDPPPVLLNGEPYQNTDYCWCALISAARDARYLGLVAHLIDRRSDEPAIYLNDEDEESASVVTFDGKVTAGDAPSLSLPSLWLRRPTIPQRYHLENWCEKSTMNDVVVPLGKTYGINILIGAGEFSFTRCAELVERAQQSQRPVRILYMSDFDPAGASMPLAVARKIEFELYARDLKDLDIQVRPILLTHEQCQRYRLPRTPIKKSDRRAANFEARFGEGATELDALEALHPGELRRIISREINRYYDEGLDRQICAVAREVEEDIKRATADVMERHTEDIAKLEAERVKLVEEIAAVTAASEKRTNAILRKIARDLRDAAPDVDSYDWPDESADGDEDDDALFDGTRGYVEQIDRYKARQGRPTTWKTTACVCEVCGVTFESRRPNTRACSPAHYYRLFLSSRSAKERTR